MTARQNVDDRELQCVHEKNKANYLLAVCHQTAAKCSNFWHSDLGDN